MKLRTAFVVAIFALTAWAGNAQKVSPKYGLDNGETPQYEVPLYFQLSHANAPPGGRGSFWMTCGG